MYHFVLLSSRHTLILQTYEAPLSTCLSETSKSELLLYYPRGNYDEENSNGYLCTQSFGLTQVLFLSRLATSRPHSLARCMCSQEGALCRNYSQSSVGLLSDRDQQFLRPRQDPHLWDSSIYESVEFSSTPLQTTGFRFRFRFFSEPHFDANPVKPRLPVLHEFFVRCSSVYSKPLRTTINGRSPRLAWLAYPKCKQDLLCLVCRELHLKYLLRSKRGLFHLSAIISRCLVTSQPYSETKNSGG